MFSSVCFSCDFEFHAEGDPESVVVLLGIFDFPGTWCTAFFFKIPDRGGRRDPWNSGAEGTSFPSWQTENKPGNESVQVFFIFFADALIWMGGGGVWIVWTILMGEAVHIGGMIRRIWEFESREEEEGAFSLWICRRWLKAEADGFFCVLEMFHRGCYFHQDGRKSVVFLKKSLQFQITGLQ